MWRFIKRNKTAGMVIVLLLSGLTYGIAGVDFSGYHNKFGKAPDGVQTTESDIWPLSDSAATQIVYVAPTEARQMLVLSSDANDTSDGTGARTLRLFGLTAWNAVETSVDATMNGVDTVTVTTTFVFLNRAKVLTSGGTDINIGNITIKAATDDSVSGYIRAGIGQTQQAIFAIPSTQTYLMSEWYATIEKQTGATGTVLFELLVNENPDVQLTNFITKNDRGLQANGTNAGTFPFDPPMPIPGPAIIKIAGIASTNDIEAAAGFTGWIQNN